MESKYSEAFIEQALVSIENSYMKLLDSRIIFGKLRLFLKLVSSTLVADPLSVPTRDE
ncbi:hypothetical protein [Nitrosomonas sp.]|uniref:hypothetical protein n=1 Tax=Nitrosomonas sp. TaxID=42353 RepID=UPI002730FDFB|nr:hypothetical protein [Nitrosomonas sp.]MDP1788050.1 hypothetical protein [Nitrosomonas sp.]MDP2223695.1 hypothetical protein [Nitrosomonas sp.]